MGKIRVMVADDHDLVRAGIRQLIDSRSDMVLVAEAGDGRELLSRIKRHDPDVVLVDISMPRLSGLEAVPMLRTLMPDVRVIVLTVFYKEGYVHQVLAGGAMGYVLKSAPAAEVVEAILTVTRGEYFLSSQINASVIRSFIQSEQQAPPASKYDQLSEREQQVFRLIIEGNTTKEIAEIFRVSPKTIEKHRTSISKKLGMNDPLAMVKYAIKIGVADPERWN